MPSTTVAPALNRRRPILVSRLTMRLAAISAWWHLLSLDAPTVAALWSWSLARALGVHLPLTAPLLLALGTWLLYVADRLLDARLLDAQLFDPRHTGAELRERHLFIHRHRRSFFIAAVPAAALLLWLIVFRMSPMARRDDTALFALTLMYFSIVHWPQTKGRKLSLPKELAVAVIFALATAVPAWVRIPHASFSAVLLAGATMLFAALCWLNCTAIDKWESSEARPATPHATTEWLQRRLTPAAIAVAATSFAATTLCSSHEAAAALFLALALAAVLLAVLNLRHAHLPALPLRIAADAALLTPLLVLPILARG